MKGVHLVRMRTLILLLVPFELLPHRLILVPRARRFLVTWSENEGQPLEPLIGFKLSRLFLATRMTQAKKTRLSNIVDVRISLHSLNRPKSIPGRCSQFRTVGKVRAMSYVKAYLVKGFDLTPLLLM